MKVKNYFERILCSDRLPDESGEYSTDRGEFRFNGKDFVTTDEYGAIYPITSKTEWWQPNEPVIGYLLSVEELEKSFDAGFYYAQYMAKIFGLKAQINSEYFNFKKWLKQQEEINNG